MSETSAAIKNLTKATINTNILNVSKFTSTVPCQSIHSSWTFPHFIVLQPAIAIDLIGIFSIYLHIFFCDTKVN